MKKSAKKFLVVFLVLAFCAGAGGSWLYDKYTVPIVMYHRVFPVDGSGNDAVTPENFRKQLDFLKRNHYRVIQMKELIEGIRQGRKFPLKTVVLTLDDGEDNNFTVAFPILKEYHFPAILFVCPGRVGKKGYMDWDQIKQMKDAGMDFGSHGMDHTYLPPLSQQQQHYEIVESKKILENKLGARVMYFAFPTGGFNEKIKDEIKNAGYQAAVTTNRGKNIQNKDVYELKRFKLTNKDTSDFILWRKLSGYFNYFAKVRNPY